MSARLDSLTALATSTYVSAGRGHGERIFVSDRHISFESPSRANYVAERHNQGFRFMREAGAVGCWAVMTDLPRFCDDLGEWRLAVHIDLAVADNFGNLVRVS